MTGPSLVVVAHGSRDPAAQRDRRGAARAPSGAPARARRPGRLRAERRARPAARPGGRLRSTGGAVVVPLLLSRGYHVAVDITRAAAAVGAAVTPPLGPDPLLTEALAGRLAEAGVPAGAPVVLAAAGSSDPAAAVDVEAQAAALAQQRGAPVVTGYASAVPPAVGAAVGPSPPHAAAPARAPSPSPSPHTCWPPADSPMRSGPPPGRAGRDGSRRRSAPIRRSPAWCSSVTFRRFPAPAGSGAARHLVARGG